MNEFHRVQFRILGDPRVVEIDIRPETGDGGTIKPGELGVRSGTISPGELRFVPAGLDIDILRTTKAATVGIEVVAEPVQPQARLEVTVVGGVPAITIDPDRLQRALNKWEKASRLAVVVELLDWGIEVDSVDEAE